MHASNNRKNHDFQIAHFLAGSCHTADGAYALLCDLREDRSTALKNIKSSRLRERAKVLKAQALMRSDNEIERLEAQADLAEIEAFSEMTENNIRAAEAELRFIDACIEKVQPHRKYAHLPDPEAHEACQREEWRMEFEFRALNFLITAGTIPPDQFAAMRQHPDFASHIFPFIQNTQKRLSEGSVDKLLVPSPVEVLLLEG